MPSFWTPFLPRIFKSSPERLRLSARVSTLEGDMLEVRQQADKSYGVLKSLQGKMYRGVQLGETVQPSEETPPPVMEPVGFSPSKQALYERAAQLRRR